LDESEEAFVWFVAKTNVVIAQQIFVTNLGGQGSFRGWV
jgi:hypothetical protein